MAATPPHGKRAGTRRSLVPHAPRPPTHTPNYAHSRNRHDTARAGHEPPLLYRPGQPTAEELEVEGVLPLGLFDYDQVPTASHTLQPGDRLLLYTDCLAQQLARCCTENPQQTLDAIMRDVNAFAKTRPPDDDQTLLLATVA